MYDLPANANAAAIVTRSLVCHPTLFREALGAAGLTHRQASATMNHHQAQVTANRLADACDLMGAWIDEGQPASMVAASIMGASMDSWITALNVAARLQCLPWAIVRDAAERGPKLPA